MQSILHRIFVKQVAALFCAIDQMMISHDVIEYDVDWPKDYAYVLNGACFSREKATLELRQRLR